MKLDLKNIFITRVFCIIEWPELALSFVSDDWWAVDIERSNNGPESRAIHIRKKTELCRWTVKKDFHTD